ncbi:molybdopterin cofactor-binding domain-containing protein [Streptomyces sp. NPDC056231]|uniref:molybdopterin cofactor-binding domain-containing protein n=1 Tax=Streptomyces sp. NPDC056231 TaxID=3345755 RepID=UPI003AACF002
MTRRRRFACGWRAGRAQNRRVGNEPEGWCTSDAKHAKAADIAEETAAQSPYVRHAFGAQYAEVAVDSCSGEVWVRRMLGVLVAGHVLNSPTVRSQFTNGVMTGLGIALTEGSAIDHVLGDFTQNDLVLLPYLP